MLSGALIAFVNAIALFGSQAIIGLPGRVFTLPTRIYALFDYPPQYGLASAMSLVFVAITVIALALQRRYLARRSYVTARRQGEPPAPPSRSAPRAGACSPSAWRVFVIAVLAPYLTLLAVSVSSRSWGLAFWQNLTLEHYRFVLFEYDVTRRAIAQQPAPGRRHRPRWPCCSAASSAGSTCAPTLRGRRLLDYASLIPAGAARASWSRSP